MRSMLAPAVAAALGSTAIGPLGGLGSLAAGSRGKRSPARALVVGQAAS